MHFQSSTIVLKRKNYINFLLRITVDQTLVRLITTYLSQWKKGKELPKTRQKQISLIHVYGDDKKQD